MTTGVSAAIDRRLEMLIVAWARRRWPALRLVPTRCLRPAAAPTARRLRRVLARTLLTTAMPVGLVLALLMV